ncbi:hypothetical protein AAFF_G00061770 [Aldrovandia affinis]|uniref:C2H2-type domain-containing protein n=1 Tax=Aldrovandia affinis TaxID=143900 RepID=A0AAD7VXS2_9TELE|nr:hypothetical protein AAFF_G00061770 [Aldrovandia affinis]
MKDLGEFYREAIEHCRSYNARLRPERSMRLPFLDSQTGVAQSNCYIWMEDSPRSGSRLDRSTPLPRPMLAEEETAKHAGGPHLGPCGFKTDYEVSLKKEGGAGRPVLESLLSAEILDRKLEAKEEEPMSETSLLQKLLVGDLPHELEVELELDDLPKRKNRNRGRSCGMGGVRRKQELVSLEDRDKPYVCDICGKRYKNRPGLSYHYAHTHLAEEEEEEDSERHTLPFQRKNNHKHSRLCAATVNKNSHAGKRGVEERAAMEF